MDTPKLSPLPPAARATRPAPADKSAQPPSDAFIASPSEANPVIPPPQQQKGLEILGGSRFPPETLERVRATAQKALSFFQANFGTPVRPLKLDLDGGDAGLHTGYDVNSDTIRFPNAKNLINSGLDSVDIINHEIFHALVCQSYPQTSTKEMMDDPNAVRLHEGLADYFAYKMNPDKYFGEDYMVGKPYLRQYQNSLAVSLAPGPHAQGNAITSYLIKNGIEPAQIKDFLQTRPFTLEGLASLTPALQQDLIKDASFQLPETVSNYKYSTAHKYRLQDDVPLRMSFRPNAELQAAHPNLRIDWRLESGIPSQHYLVRQDKPGDFQISKVPGADGEKLLALFYDSDALIGSRPFYFGPIVGPPPKPTGTK